MIQSMKEEYKNIDKGIRYLAVYEVIVILIMMFMQVPKLYLTSNAAHVIFSVISLTLVLGDIVFMYFPCYFMVNDFRGMDIVSYPEMEFVNKVGSKLVFCMISSSLMCYINYFGQIAMKRFATAQMSYFGGTQINSYPLVWIAIALFYPIVLLTVYQFVQEKTGHDHPFLSFMVVTILERGIRENQKKAWIAVIIELVIIIAAGLQIYLRNARCQWKR